MAHAKQRFLFPCGAHSAEVGSFDTAVTAGDDCLCAGTLDERGFSLIELLVVMVIIAILTAIAIPSFSAPKRAVRSGAVVSAATAYNQAILAFAQDHSGRVPCAGSPCTTTTDWSPTLDSGPLEPIPGPDGQPRRYMREGIPEAVGGAIADFRLTPMTAGAALPATGRSGAIVYVRDSADTTRYGLQVWTANEQFRAEPKCYYGSIVPPTSTVPNRPWKPC